MQRESADIDELLYLPYLHMEHLLVLTLVAQRRSISSAADTLFLSQSAISQRIQHIERALGMQLFTRGGRRGVELTEAGERAIEFAELTLKRYQEFYTETQLKLDEQGEKAIRIASTSGALRYLLPEVLARSMHAMPSVGITLQLQTPDEIDELLRDRRVDFGVRAEPFDSTIYHRIQLCEDQLLVVATPELVARVTSGAADALAGTKFSMNDFPKSQAIYDRWVRHFPAPPPQVVKINDVDARARAALSGSVFSMVPRFAVKSELDSGGLASLPSGGFPIQHKVYLIWRRFDAPTSAALEFIRFLKRDARVSPSSAA